MATNFNGYGYQQGMYMPQYYNNYQQPQPQSQSPSLQNIKFVTEQEAKDFIAFPNTSTLLMDIKGKQFWIKSADALGQISFDRYKFEKCDTIDTEVENKEKLEEKFLSKEYAQNLVERQEFDKILDKISKLEKMVQISGILTTPTQKGGE